MPDAATSTVPSLRARIGEYLAGSITLQQLDEWLFPLIWCDAGTPEVLDLAWSVDLLLMEASGGYRTDEELQVELRSLATPSVPA